MPKLRKITPERRVPYHNFVFCSSGRVGALYHVVLEDGFDRHVPPCNTSVTVYYGHDKFVANFEICKRCLKYTEEVI